MHFRSQKKTAQDISINEPLDTDSEGNDLTLIDIISVEDSIADDLDLKIKSEKLQDFISNISPNRDRRIIILRYGLDGSDPLTQREVAEMLHISRSYVYKTNYYK